VDGCRRLSPRTSGELAQGADVEDRDVRAMRAQDDRDSLLLDSLGEDRQAPIAVEQIAQTPREQIVETPDHDADGRDSRYG
jgi:hypothetical protein